MVDRIYVGMLCIGMLISQDPCQTNANDLFGDWSLKMESGTPAWMSVRKTKAEVELRFRLYVGSDGPHEIVRMEADELEFIYRKNKKSASNRRVQIRLEDDSIVGTMSYKTKDGSVERERFSGKRIPGLVNSPPNLSQLRFAHPIMLFNGKDLTGWRPHEPDKKMGWKVEDGLLINVTPKTDFSATGDFANLRTTQEFEDFWLHIEFLVEKNRNSGIYLRGMYEAQVVDRDSRMQGKQGVGAIFGLLAPAVNAGRPGGQWQAYDLTLIDRHITVVLNGQRVIDNQPLLGPTAGAINTDPMQPGPIYLQGDHTNVKYRNIYLAPIVR